MKTSFAYPDYLRIASWGSNPDWFLLLSRIRDHWREFKPGNWLQYNGFWSKDGKVFYGIGEQRGKRHNVAFVSAIESGKLFTMAQDSEGIYCTRLDIQRTIERPEDYEAREVYEWLEGRIGRLLYAGDEGDTVYIGTRTSERFVRLYEKLDRKYLRLEFEFKGKYAREYYALLCEGRETFNTIYEHSLTKLNCPDWIKDLFFTGSDVHDLMVRDEMNEDLQKKLEWLGSLHNTIVAMGRDHDSGPTVRNWLENWIAEIDNV